MTVLQFAKKIKVLCQSRSAIAFKELPVDDPKVRQPQIDLARRELGWEPTMNLEAGLTHTIDYFKDLLDNALI